MWGTCMFNFGVSIKSPNSMKETESCCSQGCTVMFQCHGTQMRLTHPDEITVWLYNFQALVQVLYGGWYASHSNGDGVTLRLLIVLK